MSVYSYFFFFFFNDTATTEIYTLSLHDALPISDGRESLPLAARTGDRAGRPRLSRILGAEGDGLLWTVAAGERRYRQSADRKSTRLNSSHLVISYAVFCLKKKKKN